MKYQLPDLREMVNDRFKLLKEPFVDNDSFFSPKEMEQDAAIFFQDGDQLFFLDKGCLINHSIASISDLPWRESSLVSSNQPLPEIMEQIIRHRLVLVQDKGDKPIGYLDISVFLRKIFESYQYLIAYFETIMKTMDASVTVIDENERVVVWTKGAENIFSLKNEEVIGKPITEFFDIQELEIIKTLKSGKSLYRHQHKARSDLFVLINTNPIRLNNRIIGAVVSETDITSQVRLNQELFHAASKVHHLEREVAKLKPSHDPFYLIKGSSDVMKNTKELIKKISSTNATVLILGESGIGKELFAKAIHDVRETHQAPFIPINCGAIPPSLFESELFGYEKGAFSGADQKGKKGKIEMARGGTLFLDEVGEMQMDMQVKLLRVLQERKYFTVGGTREIQADFRVIAATNQNLEKMVKEGRFRQDLFYRLNVVSLTIPPLRERREDIIELTHYFLYEFSIRYNRPIHGISQNIMQELINYDWPGNVRELRNTIERLVVFATDGNIQKEDLPFTNKVTQESNTLPFVLEHSLSLHEEMERHERKILLETLKLEKGNKQSCAKRLGISRATLYNRMNKLGIPVT